MKNSYQFRSLGHRVLADQLYNAVKAKCGNAYNSCMRTHESILKRCAAKTETFKSCLKNCGKDNKCGNICYASYYSTGVYCVDSTTKECKTRCLSSYYYCLTNQDKKLCYQRYSTCSGRCK